MDATRIRNEVNSGVFRGCAVQFTLWIFCGVLISYGSSKGIFLAFQRLPNNVQTFLGEAGVFGSPVAAVAVWYCVKRKTSPYFARGLGYSVIIGLALSLGVLVICGQPFFP